MIFDQVKEKLILEWNNSYTDESYKQVMDLHQYLMIDTEVSKKSMRDELNAYTYSDFKSDSSNFL